MSSEYGFRIIPPIDKDPDIVQFAQKVHGKILLLAVFALALYLHGKGWLYLTAVLTAMTFLPKYRRTILVVGTLYLLSFFNWFNWDLVQKASGLSYIHFFHFKTTIVALVLFFCASYSYLSKVRPNTWLMRRPIRNLHIIYFSLLIIVSVTPLTAGQTAYLWAFLIVLGRYLWYLSYTLLDRRSKETPRFIFQLGHYLPFWGGSNTPFPKGASYLRKIEAKNAEQLAVTQLKGIKLIYWALILAFLHGFLNQLFYGEFNLLSGFTGLPIKLDIPQLREAIFQNSVGTSYPWHVNWLALISNFIMRLLNLSVWGHIIIAICRMAGYNALRNTYKPLQAASIADFWNRYYYYYKELLVENFFYPAFLRYFKKRPKVRMFFATMAAAGFGNILYHFLRDIEYVVELGLWKAILSFQVYAFYGLMLGTGIGISQLVERKNENIHWFKRRIIKPFFVIAFYMILSIFGIYQIDRKMVITDHFSFLLNLFNISM